ncbi:MAG TPA: dienelactone hydrolase, partial [Cupriavidus sp.]|nr:dienelactone hydrolase [Cupriavidus sp.]
MHRFRWAGLLLALLCGIARASMGLTELPASGDDGPVTVYYPSNDASHPVKRGRFLLDVAVEGHPVAGNGRLIVISH